MEIETRLDEVIQEYGAFLRRTLARLCPRDLGIQREDLEQDACLRLWRALESEREIKDLASYVYRIAVTTTLDAVRRVKARREQPLITADELGSQEGAVPVRNAAVAVGASPLQAAQRAEVLRQVLRAMDRLPANRRRAVGLHLQGMSNQEVAAILGWSEPKARNLIYRGLDDLRGHLRASGITSSDDALLGDGS